MDWIYKGASPHRSTCFSTDDLSEATRTGPAGVSRRGLPLAQACLAARAAGHGACVAFFALASDTSRSHDVRVGVKPVTCETPETQPSLSCGFRKKVLACVARPEWRQMTLALEMFKTYFIFSDFTVQRQPRLHTTWPLVKLTEKRMRQPSSESRQNRKACIRRVLLISTRRIAREKSLGTRTMFYRKAMKNESCLKEFLWLLE